MSDVYKEEYLARLNKSELFEALKQACGERDVEVIALVEKIVSYCNQRTKTIIRHMGEFTLHDSDHLFRVLYLMEKLLTRQNIDRLSSPELMLLILAAFLHDIGMAPEEKEVLLWKKYWDGEAENDDPSFQDFKIFLSTKPDQLDTIQYLLKKGENANAEFYKSNLISDYIRLTHAGRAREIIKKEWDGEIAFRDINLTVELARICFSHNDDALKLLELDHTLLCGQDINACLPLIGVILRLSDIMDFDAKRTPSILFSHLAVRNPISIKEWNKHRAVEAWTISPEKIQFNAKCNHPAIEASIHEFCDMMDIELNNCNHIIEVLNTVLFEKQLTIKLPFKIDRNKIKTKCNLSGKPIYEYRNTKFTLSKKQVIDLLMGTKLYGNPAIALRELLQNSIDACLLRNAQEKVWGNSYYPEIIVRYLLEGGETILEVEDNGTGMDMDIIDNYFSKVGSSFYKSAEFYALKTKVKADFNPTSRFGIGILSCFMIADELIVDTKRAYENYKSSDPLNITVQGQDSIFFIREGNRKLPGTTVRLILRKTQNPWERMNDEKFITSVKAVVPNPPVVIKIETVTLNVEHNQENFNSVTASTLKDRTWEDHENIKKIEVKLDLSGSGIVGSAIVGILESKGEPKASIHLSSISIEVEGEGYTLTKDLELSENSISQSGESLSVDDDGEIRKDYSSRELANSKSQLSLHGIEVPSSLFVESWLLSKNQVVLKWAFPMLLRVDVCSPLDLDLNSSRTELILSEKWTKFEENLAYLICSGIKNQVTETYWNSFKQILLSRNKSDPFLKALVRVDEE